jgi:hypothetical protein
MRTRIIVMFCTVLLCIVIMPVIASCGNSASSTTGIAGDINANTRVTQQNGDKIIQMTGLEQSFSLDELIQKSDVIVTGKMVKILPPQKGVETPFEIVYTDVIFDVTEYLYGKMESKEIAIRLWGGRAEGTFALADWEPILTVNEEVTLFLFVPPNNIQPIPAGFTKNSYFKITGSKYGKWISNGDSITNEIVEGKTYNLSVVKAKIAEFRAN